MIRTQIQLTDQQAERLAQMAHERHVSVAAIVREAVDLFMAAASPSRRELWLRAEESVGRYGSGPNRASEAHDAHLDEIFGQ